MKVLADIVAELRGIFLADATFSLAILCLVGLVAVIASADPLLTGACLWASR